MINSRGPRTVPPKNRADNVHGPRGGACKLDTEICRLGKTSTTAMWYHVDRTAAPSGVEVGHGRRCQMQQSLPVMSSRHKAETSPLSAAMRRWLYTFGTAVSVLWCGRYAVADCWLGINSLLPRKACSLLCITLSNSLERNDKFDTGLWFLRLLAMTDNGLFKLGREASSNERPIE